MALTVSELLVQLSPDERLDIAQTIMEEHDGMAYNIDHVARRGSHLDVQCSLMDGSQVTVSLTEKK